MMCNPGSAYQDICQKTGCIHYHRPVKMITISNSFYCAMRMLPKTEEIANSIFQFVPRLLGHMLCKGSQFSAVFWSRFRRVGHVFLKHALKAVCCLKLIRLVWGVNLSTLVCEASTLTTGPPCWN